MRIRRTYLAILGLLGAPMLLANDRWPDSLAAVPDNIRADMGSVIEEHFSDIDHPLEPDGVRIRSDGHTTVVSWAYVLEGSGLEDGQGVVISCTYHRTSRGRCLKSTLNYDARISAADIQAAGDIPFDVIKKAKSNNSLEDDSEAAPQLDR